MDENGQERERERESLVFSGKNSSGEVAGAV